MRAEGSRFEDCLWTAGQLDDWTTGRWMTSSRSPTLYRHHPLLSPLPLRISASLLFVALVHPVMDDFTQTIWRLSHPQHSYSEDQNQPKNRPPIGESSSI